LSPVRLGEKTPEEVIPDMARQMQEVRTRGVEQVSSGG
jgi:hypothetical protein